MRQFATVAVAAVLLGGAVRAESQAPTVQQVYDKFATAVGGRDAAVKVKVKAGQLFWITNSEFDQTRTGHVLIQRKGKGHLSTGWPFAASDIETYFKAIA